MSHGNALISTPQTSYRNTSTVIRIVHSHIVTLIEGRIDRENPIGSFYGRLTLKRPERRSILAIDHPERMVYPLHYMQIARRFIHIFYFGNGHTGETTIHTNRLYFLDSTAERHRSLSNQRIDSSISGYPNIPAFQFKIRYRPLFQLYIFSLAFFGQRSIISG